MTVQSLMRLCADLGIELALKGDNNDRLVVDAPKGALTEPLRQALTEHKTSLISILKSRIEPAVPASHFSNAMKDAPIHSSNEGSVARTSLLNQQPPAATVSQFQRTDAEVKKLLSGFAYDANTIDANDLATRQLISSQLLAALSGRNPQEADCARRGFMSHGYFDDTTRQLRTADSPLDRATAARQLGIVGDSKATSHLVAALKDGAAEVRRASTESLGQIGDPSAIPSLEDLLTRESNSQLPEAVVRHAINSIAVTQAKRLPAAQAPAPRPAEASAIKTEPQRAKREIFADYLSSFEQRETLNVESPAGSVTPATSLDASVERLLLEQESLRKDAESLEQRRIEAEAAQAQKRTEAESHRMLAEVRRQKAEEDARMRADVEARMKAEAEARKRVEEEERYRQEADTLRKAAEELAQKRAEAAAARLRAEEEEARRRAEEEARRRAVEEARLRAEDEARILAEEQTRRVAEDQVRRRVEEEIRLREEEEAQQRAEDERLRAAETARQKVEEERMRRESEERDRVEAARLKAERETLLQVAAELSRRRSELEETRKNAENEARLLVEVQERSRAEEEARHQMALERQRLELEARRKADADLLKLAERRSEEERYLAAEQARVKGEQEERHLAALNSMWMVADQESKQRAETEQRIKAEILALAKVEEEQRSRIEADLKHRSETEARLKEQAEKAEQEAMRAAEVIRAKIEEETGRREELQAQLKQEQTRLEAELQAREHLLFRVEEIRNKVEEEARRRAELEARLKEEGARLQAEQEARIKVEAEAYRLAEEARVKAEAAAVSRAQVEARLQEEEARLQAEEEARAKAEAEARRLAQESSASATAEAQRVADMESRLQEEARERAEQEARKQAEAEALRLAEESRAKGKESQPLALENADLGSEPEAQVAEQLFEFSAQANSSDEVNWVEPGVQDDEHVLNALPVVDDSVYLGNETLTEYAPEPAKEIDVVMAEKGIASAEDDAGIPSEILNRLSSAQPAERAEALAEVVTIGGDDAFRCICKAFDDQVVEVRNAAARALFHLQSDRAATFTRALREGTPERRRKIGQALAGSGLAGDAVGNLTGESREKTYDAFSLLFLMAKAGEVQPLMQAIEDYPNVEVRIAVVKLLALSGQPEIIPAFRRLAVRGSLPSEVRSAVMEAIYQISSQAREHAPSAA